MLPILPLFITQFGATTFELGLIISLPSFIVILAKIPLGILAERVGRWPVIPAVAIGQTITLLLYSLVQEVQWFYPIRIIHVIVLAAFAPTAVSMILELAPSGRRGDFMGKFLTSIGLAATLGPLLCTFLVNHVDYVQMFQLVSIIPLLGLVPFVLARRRDSYVEPFNEENTSFLAFLKDAGHSRNILVLSYLRLVFSFTNAFFLTLFAVYAENSLLLVPSMIALMFGVKGLTSMLSRIPSGRLADKIGCRWPIFLAFTMLTIVYLILSEAWSAYLLFFAMAIYGLAHGMRAVSEWSLLGESASLGSRNIATAYLSTMFNVGAAIGGIVAGALSISMDIGTIFKLASIITLTGGISVSLITASKQIASCMHPSPYPQRCSS